jgi:hypothetical protein
MEPVWSVLRAAGQENQGEHPARSEARCLCQADETNTDSPRNTGSQPGQEDAASTRTQ